MAGKYSVDCYAWIGYNFKKKKKQFDQIPLKDVC